MPSVEAIRVLTQDIYRWLLRPRVRLTMTGLLLLFSGAVFLASSVWTLPCVIAGVLMVAIAWIGSRLEGHLTVEFGTGGTQFHCGARIKPHPDALPARSEPPSPLAPAAVAAVAAAAVSDAEVVDGSAQTVEIEVAELEALIAAAGQVSKTQT